MRYIRNHVGDGGKDATIYDFGIDPTRATRSPFYALEKQLIGERGYPTIPLDRPDVC